MIDIVIIILLVIYVSTLTLIQNAKSKLCRAVIIVSVNISIASII